MPQPPDPAGDAPVQDYRLRIHLQRPDHAWRAELRDASAPDAAPLTFDTPLELARHLAGTKPGAGLR